MTSVTDFAQFTDLRALAGRDRDAALAEVAGQFEALFVQEMLKSMRDAGFGDPIFGNSGGAGMYRDLFDQQIADDIASGPGIGLADLLVRQLGGEAPRRAPDAPSQFANIATGRVAASTVPRAPGAVAGLQDGAVSAPVTPPDPSTPTPAHWDSPEAFVADILPHARKVADRLGISPLGVLAQAALETGWGRHVISDDAGGNSLNLFGVKAGGDWDGGAVRRDTLEFEDGVMQRRREDFRRYASLDETFGDYEALIGGRARYAGAIGRADDVAGFASALQRGGYATDPDYAAKIRRVAGGATMRGVLGALKQNDLLSLATHVR